jgi:hypothetical protein
VLRGQNAAPQCEVQAERCGPVRYSALYQTLVGQPRLHVEPAPRAIESAKTAILGTGGPGHADGASGGARGADLSVPRALAGRSPAPQCRAERGLGEGKGTPGRRRARAFPTSVECTRETWLPNGPGILLARPPSTQAWRHQAYPPPSPTGAEASPVERCSRALKGRRPVRAGYTRSSNSLLDVAPVT